MAEPSAPGFSWTSVLRGAGHGLLRLPRPLAWALLLAWMGMIWWFSDRRIDLGLDPTNRLWPVVSNMAHAPLFGVQALLVAALVLGPQRGAPWPHISVRHGLAILLPVALWGGLDEWHQSWMEGRHSTAMDVLMDLLGGVLVLWIVVYLGRPAASETGLRRRLLSGIAICLVAAVLTTRDLG